ncbi:MAG: DNA polymerase I, partial [candidate division WOR-3 bacterium]
PEDLGVALDREGPTVRHEKFGGYKATRKPMPADLIEQLPYIERVCRVFRVPVIAYPGYEADDVIGTLTRQAAEQGIESIIVTSDKDMLQLVSDRIVVLDPMKDKTIYDAQKVQEKLGVRPDQVPDLLGLWGDATDNIPGAPGIGEKGARELIQAFGSIENLLESWDKVRKKAYQDSLRDYKEQIRMSKELATIQRNLPIELDLDSLRVNEPDREAAFELFSELEFNSLKREFLQKPEESRPLKSTWLNSSDKLLETTAGKSRVYVALEFAAGPLGKKIAEVAGIKDGDGEIMLVDLKSTEGLKAWRAFMTGTAAKKICWDSKPLYLSLEQMADVSPEGLDDVMLMAFLTAPHIGDYSIGRWALDELHVSLPDDECRAQGSLINAAGNGEAAIGRRLDALQQLHQLLAPRIDQMELHKLYAEIELPLVPVLADMERTGIKVDPEMLKRMSAEMERHQSELTRRIYQAAGTEFNINSAKQLGEILFEKLNLPILKKTRKTGSYSTDQAVLEELAREYELPRLILEYRQVAKLKSTYVDALPALINPATGRIHTSFNQTGTATGRLSSSEPNLQNIPIRSELGRLIRSAFVPEKGNLLISADYSQVELRILAHLSGDEVLISAFRAGEDIHERTAREVFTEEELKDRAECRRRAKVINFGIIYGLSAFGLAQTLGISKEAAQSFIDAYFNRYRGVRAWLDRTIEETRRTGYTRTLFGRIRPIPDIQSKDFNLRSFAERTAVNSPIQGTAADIIKIAMIRVYRSLRESKLSAKILLQVHDELVLEAPETEVEKVGNLVREEMEKAATLKVPLKVEVNVADNWMDMK